MLTSSLSGARPTYTHLALSFSLSEQSQTQQTQPNFSDVTRVSLTVGPYVSGPFVTISINCFLHQNKQFIFLHSNFKVASRCHVSW